MSTLFKPPFSEGQADNLGTWVNLLFPHTLTSSSDNLLRRVSLSNHRIKLTACGQILFADSVISSRETSASIVDYPCLQI